MSLRSVRVPKYRHHKGSGQAFVQLRGERHYLGKYGTEESQQRYRRFLAENVTSRRVSVITPVSPVDGLTVVELAAAYWQFAESYYVKDGKPTGHLYSVKVGLRWLRDLYGGIQAESFGPLALRAIQQKMVDAGNARGYVNQICSTICRAFRWTASQELIPVTTCQALATVPGLKKGRTTARETAPVPPVSDEAVNTTLPHLPAVVADMLLLQRLTGARPGEVCILRPCDIERSEDIWSYRPESHKTEHHGRERIIFIGPRAQAILRPYLLREVDAYCFSPAESEKNRLAELHAGRNTPLSCGNRPGMNRKRAPRRKAGSRYTTGSYRRAIHRACDKAAIDRWSPNQLRHSAGTEIRRQFGLEAAQVTLGHAKADVTQVYAERDAELARDVARKIG
ncbi:hypothetical protein LCGC14_2538830 [marine sediment metagenome]|uniref:Tyr recombinase domain-containing protein n=1 Tax=marine sediment metagenome TaxID=412755 RepID=A0A0F9BE54_9ZZZZ